MPDLDARGVLNPHIIVYRQASAGVIRLISGES